MYVFHLDTAVREYSEERERKEEKEQCRRMMVVSQAMYSSKPCGFEDLMVFVFFYYYYYFFKCLLIPHSLQTSPALGLALVSILYTLKNGPAIE